MVRRDVPARVDLPAFLMDVNLAFRSTGALQAVGDDLESRRSRAAEDFANSWRDVSSDLACSAVFSVLLAWIETLFVNLLTLIRQ